MVMPDADGRIPPVAYSLSDEEWRRIFESDEDLDVGESEWGIVWTPDLSLDGAYFISE